MADIVSPENNQVFTLEDSSRFEIDYSKILGEGSYGKVYGGTYVSADGNVVDNNVAIKVQLKEGLDKNFQKEIKMSTIQKIVYNMHIADNNLYMIMPDLGKALPEYLEAGQNLTDDFDEIQKNNKKSIEVVESSSEQKNRSDIKHDSEVDVSFDTTIEYDSGSDVSFDTTIEYDSESESDVSFGTTIEYDSESESDASFGTTIEYDSESESDVSFGTTVEYDSESDSPAGSFITRESEENDSKPAFLKHQFQDNGNDLEAAQKKIFSLENIPAKPFNMLDFNEKEHHLRLDETLDVFEKMAHEVDKAHNNGILHLDIKSDNFLRDPKTGEVALIDFGVSRFSADNKKKRTTGTVGYMAPELILRNPTGVFTAEQDVYSLGRTYLTILAGPLAALNRDSVVPDLPIPSAYIDREVRGSYHQARDALPELENFQFRNEQDNPEIHAINQLVSLMNNMLQLNATNRPSMSEIKQAFNTMRTELKQADEKIYLQALENVSFRENKMESRFMAQRAIRDFNAEQLQAWRRQPEDARASKPVSLDIPENTKLDALVSAVKNNNQTKERTSPATPEKINVAAPQGSDQKTSNTEPMNTAGLSDQKNLGVQRVNLLIKNIAKRVNECPTKNNRQQVGAFKSFMVQFQRGGEMSDLLKKLDDLANNSQMDGPGKLEQLRSDLQKSMDESQKNAFSKSEKSDFYKVCKESIENIDSLQSHKPSERTRNKM